ncbi:MAG: ABC transporter permease, partial [Oscillospiraceae bacterium]
YTLYTLGLLNAQALQDAVEAAARGEDVNIDTQVHSYSYDDILALRFRLLTNTDCFVRQDGQWVDKSDDEAYLLNVLNGSDEIAVVGILRPAEGATTGSGQSGVIGYRADLMTHLLDKVTSAEIVREQKADPTVDVFTGLPFEQEELKDAYTMEELQAYAAQLPAEAQQELMGYVSSMQAAGMDDGTIATQLMHAALSQSDGATYTGNLKRLGVSDPDDPEAINLFPKDFEAKDRIADRIAEYNKSLPEDAQLAYTDYIGLMISSITTIINAISYILIAFVAVSLVVSSIMIGIITYISVLERTREIGVHRFRRHPRVNAEIRLCAGAIGTHHTAAHSAANDIHTRSERWPPSAGGCLVAIAAAGSSVAHAAKGPRSAERMINIRKAGCAA